MSSCLYGPWVADTLGCHIPVIRCCRAVCSHISAELTRGAISGGTHFQTHCLSNSPKFLQTSVILMRWRSDLLFIINPFSKERSISLEQASKTQIELKKPALLIYYSHCLFCQTTHLQYNSCCSCRMFAQYAAASLDFWLPSHLLSVTSYD